MEVEIQLPFKRFPDSSVFSLIPTGWCMDFFIIAYYSQ